MKKTIFYTIAITLFLLSTNITLAETNLEVPFTTQSPYKEWIPPWDNACEETSITMINAFYHNYPERNIVAEDAAPTILKIVDIEDKYFGFNEDTNSNQNAYLIDNYFSWESTIVKNPTIAQIKHEIDVGHPVILPVYLPYLPNPYYSTKNLDYHVIVISGYDDEPQEFITQDPGTRRGLDLHYSYDSIMYAMHDFLPDNKTPEGEPMAIFTSPNLVNSKNIDIDGDGLNKEQEIKYGTLLDSKDSDGDGRMDGAEVKNGYSPTTAEEKLIEGILVKGDDNNPVIYLIENGQKRAISSEKVFLGHGWKWSDIKTINSIFLEEQIATGLVVNS